MLRRMMKPLEGHVALVAGATRGAGRGIARMLGEAGAIVYCSGRSSRTQANTSDHVHAGRPETIEETAELVSAAGGIGIPVRVDHTIDEEVAALFARIQREQQRLDVLVNILTGRPVRSWQTFWHLPVEEGRAFVNGWIWPHVATCWHAAPLMVKRQSGLMVEIIEQDGIGYHGQFFFDLMEISLKRLSYGMAHELAAKGVTALAIAPGFMRTEAILHGFGATEASWREAAEHHPEAKQWGFISSETPCFVGRAVAALAADPQVRRKSGGIYDSWSLSEEYGFTDLDGTRPNMPRYLREHHPQLVNRKSPTAFDWKVVASGEAVTS
jgi:NAD(P)-dependent dehydrogenase (short-subunit alcohol dehydrogenase family)